MLPPAASMRWELIGVVATQWMDSASQPTFRATVWDVDFFTVLLP